MASHRSLSHSAQDSHRRPPTRPVWFAGGFWAGAICAQVGLLLAVQASLAKSDDVAVRSDDDVQDLLFCGPLRPIWIKLRVTIDGRPFREVWRSNVRQVFADVDANHDGAV